MAIPALMVGLGAVGSYAQARQANANAKASATSAKYTTEYNKSLGAIKLASDQTKLAHQFTRYLGTVSADAAARGVGQGGSTQAIQTSAWAQALSDQTDLEFNNQTQNTALDQQYAADLIRINATRRSVFFDTINGGLQGLQGGIALANGVRMMRG